MFGCLSVLSKDGVEGASFDIVSDILIGRNAECEIRIKIPSVSRKQTRLFINENGRCCIEQLSGITPTFLNGKEIVTSALHVLEEHDEISIAGRKFLYHLHQSSSANVAGTDSAAKLKQADRHSVSLSGVIRACMETDENAPVNILSIIGKPDPVTALVVEPNCPESSILSVVSKSEPSIPALRETGCRNNSEMTAVVAEMSSLQETNHCANQQCLVEDAAVIAQKSVNPGRLRVATTEFRLLNRQWLSLSTNPRPQKQSLHSRLPLRCPCSTYARITRSKAVALSNVFLEAGDGPEKKRVRDAAWNENLSKKYK